MSRKPASALPNAQKQNSSVFANGIFNNTQRAGELALQQTPTLNPAVPAQLEQINRAGNTSAGPTYLAATQRSNSVIGELVALVVDKGAEALGMELELTPFHGHLIVHQEGVQDAQTTYPEAAVSGAISSANG